MKRIVLDFVIILSIFILPWWISLPLIFIGLLVFEKYYEFFLYFIIFYNIHLIFVFKDNLNPIIFTILICALYFGFNYLKKFMIISKGKDLSKI